MILRPPRSTRPDTLFPSPPLFRSGTQQLRANARGDLVSVFVLPPSAAALEDRLRSRAQDSDEVIAGRMAKAAEEISHYPEYDYVIVDRKSTRLNSSH